MVKLNPKKKKDVFINKTFYTEVYNLEGKDDDELNEG